jgi:hypothetical protein
MIEMTKGHAGNLIEPLLQFDTDGPDAPAVWWRLVEQIVQLEELIAELKEETDGESAVLARDLRRLLKEKRVRLKSIDVCC